MCEIDRTNGLMAAGTALIEKNRYIMDLLFFKKSFLDNSKQKVNKVECGSTRGFRSIFLGIISISDGSPIIDRLIGRRVKIGRKGAG